MAIKYGYETCQRLTTWLCALGAATFRFPGSAQGTGAAGTLTFGPGIAAASLGRITASVGVAEAIPGDSADDLFRAVEEEESRS